MTQTNNIPFLLFLLLFARFGLRAQEKLVPLSTNLQLMSLPVKNTLAGRTTSVTTLDTLPFFEDFSYSPSSPYPTVSHWLDSNVFVNHGFPIAPPTIGVATFDGLNKRGYPYNLYATGNSSGPADKLTSRPINLQKKGAVYYSPSDSVYLSFYYQGGGRGSDPSQPDSLILDFYKPRQKKWHTAWSRKGYGQIPADTLFHLVMLPIKDTAYFDSLFQFRFRNRATLSGSLDHWHIDNIYIDLNRSYKDTIMEDEAFQYMSTSFLKNYSAMPYRHYQPAEMASSIKNYMRNNFTFAKNTTYNYTVFDTNNMAVNSYNGGSANMMPYATNGLHNMLWQSAPTVSFAFPAPMTGMNIYTIKHVISSTPDAWRQNDTIWQTQRFTDYFAYDDGTAEQAYALLAATGSKYALRYTLNVPDTLRALRIYFDPTKDGPGILNSSFNIMVWESGPNGPGNLIYSDNNNHRPVYLQDKYNAMPAFFLSSCLLLKAGTYYFGIRQNTTPALNIGFDRNNDHSDALFFDVGDGWEQSFLKGSLMINPVMGCHEEIFPVSVKAYSGENTGLTLFPNPAQNTIAIKRKGMPIEQAAVSIVSSIGQTVYAAGYSSGETIDVSTLPNGIYFVYLSGGELVTSPQKLIIAR